MQFGKLLEEVFTQCGLRVLRRAATGGSTTTVVDSGWINKKGDGFYAQGSSGGYILFLSQTTDRAAPEGQFGEVSSYTLSTTTPTYTIPTLSASAQSGDIYSLMKPNISLYEMIAQCNEGLRRLPPLELVDTTLTGTKDTLYYTLPFAVGQFEILGIEIGNDTDGWQDLQGWSVTPYSGGTANKLILNNEPPYDTTTPANQTFKIRYLAKHPTLSIYSDYVEKSVPDDVAIAACTLAAFELLMLKRPNWYGDKTKAAMYQDIMRKYNERRTMSIIRQKPATRNARINLSEY